MANRERGEREIEIGQKRYTAVMDLEAMCRLEDHWTQQYDGKETTFAEVMEKGMRGSIKHARSILWASLLRHHPDVTLADVSGITFLELQQQMKTLGESTGPDEADLKEAGIKGKRPQKAQVNGAGSTGANSTSKPGASA